jgi:hypothetical protein
LSNDIEKKKIVIYSRADWFIAMVLFVSSICYKPMILGNDYAFLGIMGYSFVIVFCLARKKGKVSIATNTHFRTYIAGILLFIYCFFQCILLKSDRQTAAIQTCILLILATSAYFVVLGNKGIAVNFIRITYYAMCFFSISYLISLALMFRGGWDSILVTTFDYSYFTKSNIYFPFTTTYGTMPLNGILLRRLLGFARESGIMQVFYIWGFYSADKYFENPKRVQILMVIGVAACLSTNGFIAFGISLILYLDINKILSKKTIVIVFLAFMAAYLLFHASGTRISDRAIATIDDRKEGIEYGLQIFKEKPLFGGGFYSTLGDANIQTGICAIASLGQVGIIGISMWLMTYVFAFLDAPNKKRFIYTNIALFITALFGQPMVFAPVMYWFLFTDYDDLKIYAVRKGSKRYLRLQKGGSMI